MPRERKMVKLDELSPEVRLLVDKEVKAAVWRKRLEDLVKGNARLVEAIGMVSNESVEIAEATVMEAAGIRVD